MAVRLPERLGRRTRTARAVCPGRSRHRWFSGSGGAMGPTG